MRGNTVELRVDGYGTIDMEYQRDEHRVHLIVYHLVWCPKRRKAVLVGDVARDCRALIEAKCVEKGWAIQELAIQLDHVHLFVRAWPTTSAADILKEVKGVTSRELRLKHPQLRRLPRSGPAATSPARLATSRKPRSAATSKRRRGSNT